MIAVDSIDNQRSRAEFCPQETVEWLTEGGRLLTLTVVDGGQVDVVYEHWLAYKSEAQAAALLI
ncbi:hypothetical protein GN244_ATG15535 [Phytophthora infestans]|uniref:Uncharacterized protein n=1 Tax=Phytophthora infestans TaxID=4787 RepID=A0A833SFC1_PHYIN|nr:hypothetical protein GN244_ATG15535 [Phytophthora infestans]KAF4142359.1 hypothetical protein GN958_ATG08535 [Phytophthora infestans]